MSADYLIMEDLLNYCIKFIVQNVNAIILSGDQVANYKSHIAKKIADKITIEQLDKMVDPNDLMFSRIYKKKLEIFFEKAQNLLTLCENCN